MHPVERLLTPLGKLFRNRHADGSKSISHAPGLATENRITVTSPSFADGQEIPAKFCGRFIGDNISPALSWSPLPANAAHLLLIIEDLDSPGAVPRLHAVAEFPATMNGLDEGALTAEAKDITFLSGRRGPLVYAGPRPLPGHGSHHYRFHLYALDSHVDLDRVSGVEELPAAASGHVLASGVLTGTRES
ncbi:YbhB/YbcL family Raf kinase inhibitor-like protein [Gryllotalpicola reticulitermitis]|uniref:YbhB/YbcL family Raf kinase inhibitor-like protein n=1 Tax=Gryllotalpicola reticulitermitis TaxID=1184153 RepID=A0ABV8QA28_9MICO